MDTGLVEELSAIRGGTEALCLHLEGAGCVKVKVNEMCSFCCSLSNCQCL